MSCKRQDCDVAGQLSQRACPRPSRETNRARRVQAGAAPDHKRICGTTTRITTYKRPGLINNYLHSALIMADMCDHLRRYMIEGAERAEPKLTENIERSVMMVTALSPIIGYGNASVFSHYAIDHNLTLKQAPVDQGVSEELHDRWSTRSRRPKGSADLAPVAKQG